MSYIYYIENYAKTGLSVLKIRLEFQNHNGQFIDNSLYIRFDFAEDTIWEKENILT